MKIALVTDDGKTISEHFGRASYYLVVTIEDGMIVHRELREKLGHAQFFGEPHPHDDPSQPHGLNPASHVKHLRMAQNISDCETVLCRGMGAGAYESLKIAGIRPLVTDIADIDAAIEAYLDGSIVDHVERLH